MVFGVYCIFDVVSDSAIIIGTSSTDGAFIRQNVPYLSKMNENYVNDYVIYKVGSFTESNMKLEACEPVVVPWDSYNNPETVAKKS